MKTSFFSADVTCAERSILGAILLDGAAITEAREHGLAPEHFSLDSHRRIYGGMVAIAESSRPIDYVTLSSELEHKGELENIGGDGYVSGLVDGVPDRPSIKHYIDIVLKHATYQQLIRQVEFVKTSVVAGAELPEIEKYTHDIIESIQTTRAQGDWRSLFHSYDDVVNVPPVRFAIDGFLQEEGITLIGGLAGHGKTLCMLAMVRALLEGSKLFTRFAVTKPAARVIYLIPEAGLGPFSARLKMFRLEEYVRDGRLLCQTLSSKSPLSLTDPRLLKAAQGADMFLDTAIRFMTGDENSATEQKAFADTLFALQRAGARTITGAHHSPKSFGRDTFMTLENVLRGSGDIGAMLCACWGLSQIDADKNRIFVQNVKARDFQPCEPFIIQARPSLDQTGYFEMPEPPGFAGSLSDHKDKTGGRPELPDKAQKIADARRMKDEGNSYRDISKVLGVSIGWLSTNLKEATV